ncbi:uncharacterized protein DUF4054 [Novosphingobium sp. PhB165]|uniref:DUF4054 domain-containing protein n=1 Tax=Novosphingobium sp. PhB165 TaxID=2485105 RepID=UPI00104BC549|nr:DUF4054 domain-containing protein [Novosphingobium sp. PhB165]TCM21480.1 uncharacterized protein DUF4054 [Novosphingobium sp. PhB165]
MAYTPPNKATFIAIFPAFAAVTDEQYAFWSAQAALITDPMEACLGARMDLATMLVTAHYLTQQGIGTGTEAEMAAQGASGFTRIKSGQLELQRSDSSGTDADGGDWATTSYGQRVWPMLSACAGSGPLVSGTGRVVGVFGYRAGPMPWQRY